MMRLRIGIAVIWYVCSAAVCLADDAAGMGAFMASRAAADALLSPSNTQNFAKSKDSIRSGSDSVGGNAAAQAAGVEITSSEDDVPLPVRKPKPVYKSGVKTYETASAGDKPDKAAGSPEDKTKAEAKGKAGTQPPVDAAKAAANGKTDPKAADPKGPVLNDKAIAKSNGSRTEWPALEVELAKARCTQLLKGIDAVYVSEPALRAGECGAPAPVRLVSIGKDPEAALSPPALLTCDMVVALHKWVKSDLQPLARKHLSADIVRIDTMSDYSCRRAYGRTANRLSEHGKANALDIRGFVTAKAQTANVLEEWGPTRRDTLAYQVAAAKARAAKEEAARLAADKKAQENLRDPKAPKGGEKEPPVPPATTGFASGAPGGGLAKTTIIDGLPKLTITLPGGTPVGKANANETALGVAPQRLGGPKNDVKDSEAGDNSKAVVKEPGQKAEGDPAKTPDKRRGSRNSALEAVPYPAPKTATSRFLHEAHVAACRIFGTTLGPEANEAHRNHFHVDMAERKVTKICE